LSLVLIGGGSRSGKSTHALTLARAAGTRRGFLATSEAIDDEMTQRIARHQEERGAEFLTIEEPLELERVIRERQGALDVLVIDCLTLWLSNLLRAEREPAFDGFLETAAESPLRCIAVTNEVGCGIVPDNTLARRFRDAAGTLNQRAAARAIEVYWMVFGVSVRVK
jgi:adenosylcobinamide kinase/adenosylcobinamide-phosphate guanylyltransferase